MSAKIDSSAQSTSTSEGLADLESAVKGLEEALAEDEKRSDDINALPKSIFNTQSVYQITSRNEGEKLGNNAKKASNMLAVHIGRLAAEAEDRVNLLRILNATFNTQRKALKEERSKLKDCETKRKRAVAAKESLLKRIKIVPAVPQPRRENHPIKPGNGTSGDKTVLNKETLKANRQHWPPSQRLPSPRMDAPPWWPQQNNGQMQGQSLPRAVPPYGKMNVRQGDFQQDIHGPRQPQSKDFKQERHLHDQYGHRQIVNTQHRHDNQHRYQQDQHRQMPLPPRQHPSRR
eukprot:UC4_evm1s1180